MHDPFRIHDVDERFTENNAGVVDQNVDPAMLRDDRGENRPGLVGVGDVENLALQ